MFLSLNLYGKNNYIVIADDLTMLRLFRDDKNEIINMAKDISEKYDGVVLHLGNTVIFDKGGQFYYETSKKNLSEFINTIKNQNKKVYLWFFDTFGSSDFSKLYDKHEEVLKNLRPKLNQYNFDGIILDLEWINYNEVWAGVPAKFIKNVEPKQTNEINHRIAQNYSLYASWYQDKDK